jgi:diguanylate cyclase (GGDEF)-like protein
MTTEALPDTNFLDQRRITEALRSIAQALNDSLELKEVLETILQNLAQLIPFDRSAIFLKQNGHFQIVASRGFADPASAFHLRLYSENIPLFRDILHSRQPMIVTDAQNDPRLKAYPFIEHVYNWIGAPLLSRGQVAIGLLVVECFSPICFNESQADLAAAFGDLAALATENLRLSGEVQRLTTIDELTEVLNRRHFFAMAERELHRSMRLNTALSAILLDLDHFKKVNDTYGHAAGDQVLHDVAQRVLKSIRDIDILGRYGGEEFAVLLPDTNLMRARQVAERLRKQVSELPVLTRSGPVSITVSLGAAALEAADKDLTTLLNRANAALQSAKQAGRNRTEVKTS